MSWSNFWTGVGSLVMRRVMLMQMMMVLFILMMFDLLGRLAACYPGAATCGFWITNPSV